MEELDFNNILGEQDIDTLFSDPDESATEESDAQGEEEAPNDKHDDTTTETTEVVNPETLFDEEEEKQPESVGSGNSKEEKEKEDATPNEDAGASPNFYSSIANALAVDGVFPNLDEETVKKVGDAEGLSDLIEAEVNARLDEKQQRISKALENGVEASDIKRYENTLQYINSISDTQISEESEKGEQLRRNLIYQDFLNKGYTPDKAQKMTERAIDAGTDVEDAKEALQSNQEYFQKQYDALLDDAQKKAEEEKAERVKQAGKLKNSLLKDKQLIGDFEISSDLRKKTFDNISRPIYKDLETGTYLTALQKYEAEHRADFLKYTGLFFTLTNGFKDFDSFTKGKVKKEVKKGLRELEQVLNSSSRNTSGNLNMVTRTSEDPESYIGKGLKLDL